MRDRYGEFEASGLRVVAIGMGPPDYARRFHDELRLPFDLLYDEARLSYAAAALLPSALGRLLAPRVWLAAWRAWRAGHRQVASGENVLQLGGGFVFGPEDRDLLVHVNASFEDNVTIDALIGALRTRTKPTA